MKHYVYALLDPRSDEVFYIGKGQGNRAAAHLHEAAEEGNNAPKHQRIREIQAAGEQVRLIYMAKDFEEEREAYIVESLLIYEANHQNSILGLNTDLTNLASGHYRERFRPWGTPHKVAGFEYDPSSAESKALLDRLRPLYEYVIEHVPEFNDSKIEGEGRHIKSKKRKDKFDFHYALWPKKFGSEITFEYYSPPLIKRKDAKENAKKHADRLKNILKNKLDLDCNYDYGKIDIVPPGLKVEDPIAVAKALQEFINRVDQAEEDLAAKE